jgi:hypothetical protein
MLAEAEEVETGAVAELDLLEHVGEAFVDVDRLAGHGIAVGLDEGVGAELYEGLRSGRFSPRRERC